MSGPGAHIILGREDAKQLFLHKDDEAIRSFVTGIRQSRKHRDAQLVLECDDSWDPIHRCFSDGTLDHAGGDFPLNHCVLGGKRLHGGTEFEAVLIRPDIVPHVADSLHHIKRAELHQKYFAIDPQDYGRPLSEADFDKVWLFLQQIRKLFEDAAQDRSAVLFTVAR